MDQSTTYVKLKAIATAVLLMVSTLSGAAQASVAYVLLACDAVSAANPWDGYAYDYFAEDYTVETWG